MKYIPTAILALSLTSPALAGTVKPLPMRADITAAQIADADRAGDAAIKVAERFQAEERKLRLKRDREFAIAFAAYLPRK